MTPSRTRLVRLVLAAAVSTPLVTSVPAAADDPSIEELPSLSEREVDRHREAISIPETEPISIPPVEPFEPTISSSGGNTVVSLDTDVLFEFGEAELTDPAMDAVVEAVSDVPDGAKVKVVGHTDSIGSDADNLTLSKQRARAVADVLVSERADLDVTVSGRGEKDPVAPNESGGKDNPAGREQNRRVEIRYAD